MRGRVKKLEREVRERDMSAWVGLISEIERTRIKYRKSPRYLINRAIERVLRGILEGKRLELKKEVQEELDRWKEETIRAMDKLEGV
jgi:hypothetical protein